MTAIIIDDEPLNIHSLKSLLAKHCSHIQLIGEANSVADGLRLLTQVQADIVFLDILMPPSTGFELLKLLKHYQFEVIFVTAYNSYALQAIKFSALDYLLKPVTAKDLKLAIDKARNQVLRKQTQDQIANLLKMLSHPQPASHRIGLHLFNEIRLVYPLDIICLVSKNSYTNVYLQGQSQPLLVSTAIFEFEGLLSAYHFIRTHQSWLVNQLHVASIIRKDGICELLLTGGIVAPVSRAKRNIIKDLLLP
jgi:two-component system LytT family response regulator